MYMFWFIPVLAIAIGLMWGFYAHVKKHPSAQAKRHPANNPPPW